MKPYIIEKTSDGILMFTINNPEKRNAINYEIMDALEDAIKRTEVDCNIKVFVITGSGKEAFCSGGDLSIFKNLRTEDEAYGMLSKMSRILYKLLTLPKPTVALLNGIAIGGGCELAAACDFRIAKNGARAGFVQGRLGITTGWGGGTILIEKLVPANALKLLLEAKVHSTPALVQLGFIDSVYEEEKVKNLAEFLEDISSLELEVLTAYKLILTKKWKSTNLEGRILEEVQQCSRLWGKEAHHQKVQEFLKGK